MTPGVGRGISDDKSLERQMGCMAGFLQLFDRNQIHTGKRLYASRRLPSSPVAGSTSPSDRSEVSSVSLVKEIQRSPSPEACPSLRESCAPVEAPAKLSLPFQLPLPVSDIKDGQRSCWKLREAPRLSLDSRAVVDAGGKLRPREIRTAVSGNQSSVSEVADESERQRRSPSVVARLMGLDALPESGGDGGGGGQPKRAELRRSASESRVPRDYRFVDVSSFQKPHMGAAISGKFFGADFGEVRLEYAKLDSSSRTPLPPLQRKSFFDAQDFFPEPPKRMGSLYGEIERRLRMRGIDEPAKDLETLKQILEVLQLKGLLRSKLSETQINGHRNLIYDHRQSPKISSTDSPVVVMKPTAKPSRRPASERPPIPSRSTHARRAAAVDGAVQPARARPDRAEVDQNPKVINNNRRTRTPSSPEPSSPARRRALNAEPPTSPQTQQIVSGIQSPKASPKRFGQEPLAVRSPRNRRVPTEISPKDMVYSMAEDDTSTTASESSISSSPRLDFERSRSEEYRAGKSLLERCDRLLHSIAAITGTEQLTAVEKLPSPVSVLDSSFLCDESSSSPVTKRAIDFQVQPLDWKEDNWSPATPATRSNGADGPDAEDHDYVYVSQIVRVSDRVRDPSDVYAVLEKRHQEPSPGLSKVSRLHRRLVFDTVAEILDRKRHASPWEAFTCARSLPGFAAPLVREVWLEVRRIRQQLHPADDFNDVTSGAIRKDLDGDRGWGSCPSAEMSDAVLYIERQIFKDLVAETIRGLADLSSPPPPRLRRKLVF